MRHPPPASSIAPLPSFFWLGQSVRIRPNHTHAPTPHQKASAVIWRLDLVEALGGPTTHYGQGSFEHRCIWFRKRGRRDWSGHTSRGPPPQSCCLPFLFLCIDVPRSSSWLRAWSLAPRTALHGSKALEATLWCCPEPSQPDLCLG